MNYFKLTYSIKLDLNYSNVKSRKESSGKRNANRSYYCVQINNAHFCSAGVQIKNDQTISYQRLYTPRSFF